MEKRDVFGQKFVVVILFLWAGASVLLNTTIKYFFVWKKEDVNSVVDFAVLALLVINIVFFHKYTPRDIGIIVLGTLLIGIATINSKNNSLMAAWIFVVASKNVPFNRIVRMVYLSQLMAFGIVIYLFFRGYIDDKVFLRGDITRHSLGFTHPNQLGVMLFLLAAYRLYNRKDKLNGFDVLLTLFMAYFVYKVPNCNTSFYALVILGIIVFIHVMTVRLGGNLEKLSIVYIATAVIVNAISIIFSTCNPTANPLVKKFDYFMSLRFSLCYKTYRYYGISWLGQDVQLFVNKIATGKFYHFWLDNSYMALLLRYGIVVYVCFSCVYVVAMIHQKKKKDYLLIEIMCLYAIYGVMENNFFSISQNIFLILLGVPLFQKVEKKVIQTNSLEMTIQTD
ncbi:hypothetical protein [Butyrivibrio sp. VCB2006]|uniref:hypothetical protein n=1 Tax=Butyrivibrio sp. VCB2006 TaxID=1280679 RepID=UPI000420488B|nr:hypothetical protein [Butyrivibrio sp. VCB2006]